MFATVNSETIQIFVILFPLARSLKRQHAPLCTIISVYHHRKGVPNAEQLRQSRRHRTALPLANVSLRDCDCISRRRCTSHLSMTSFVMLTDDVIAPPPRDRCDRSTRRHSRKTDGGSDVADVALLSGRHVAPAGCFTSGRRVRARKSFHADGVEFKSVRRSLAVV